MKVVSSRNVPPQTDVPLTKRHSPDYFTYVTLKQSSLTWPKEWRAVIYKIDTGVNADGTTGHFRVWPRNPEYDNAMENQVITYKEAAPLPTPYLPAITFPDIEAINRWAEVATRVGR